MKLSKLKIGSASEGYSSVTELPGDEVTPEQVERLCHRYYWAGRYCRGKDVIEAACGAGQGLGLLAGLARSLRAGDYDERILAMARAHYGQRLTLQAFDAQVLPYPDHSADSIILFEALYYLPDVERFMRECIRVLRQPGTILVATANKDLYDFNPSPYSHRYYGTVELAALFRKYGFQPECFGYCALEKVSWRQRLWRPLKMIAARLGLIPKTTRGKQLLKRLVFGKLTTLPAEIREGMISYQEPAALSLEQPDRQHKVIYCAATLS